MSSTAKLRDLVLIEGGFLDDAWHGEGTNVVFDEDTLYEALINFRKTFIAYEKAAEDEPIITITELKNRFPHGTELILSNDLYAKSSSHSWVLEITPNLDEMKETWPWPMGLAYYGSTPEKCTFQAHKALLDKKR